MSATPLPPTNPAPILVQTRLGPIECAVAGDGPALLAIHGGMGGHDQSWLLARALLGETARYRVIAVSRPGYLGTPLAAGPSHDTQSEIFAALLDALGIETAAVAAVSAGGPSAIAFATRFPERCRALLLVSACTGRLETPPEVLRRMRPMALIARLPGLIPLMRWRSGCNPEASAGRSIKDPAVRERTLRHGEAVELLRVLRSSVFDRTAKRLPGTINDIERFARLEQGSGPMITAPTLVIHGERDSVVPFSHALAVQRLARQAELMAIPDGEHVALFTHLDQVRETAAGYVR
jgi:pimeloyl-ACP methyl ester carboxylesterase